MENIKSNDNGKYNTQKWGLFLENAIKRQKITSDRQVENEDYETPHEYQKYKNEFIGKMKQFQQNNMDILDEHLNMYEQAISNDFFESHYVLLNEKRIKSVLSRCKVMILTANPIEKALFHYMIVHKSNGKIRRILCDNNAYFILKWGKYWVAHIHQTETGAYKNLGSNATIYEALKYFTPNVIISLGVAFGIDYETQNIGDVIVSKRILPYSENKRDEDKIKPDRNQDKKIDDWLHVRLVNANGFLDGVTYGDILTGGSVMSSFVEKDKICAGYTKADFIIGGEMEGNALFQYSKTNGIPGVVIKGICDWGVAKNDIFPSEPNKEEKFKDSLQAFAMANAVDKCDPLFNDKEIFSSPKNINTISLKKQCTFCKINLIISQIMIFVHGLLLLFPSLTREFNINDSNPPFIWLAYPIIITITLLGWKIQKTIKNSEYYIDRELKH